MKRLAIIFLSFLFWTTVSNAQEREFSIFEERVLGAYLAYYGRPADPGGLEFWAQRLESEGGDLSSIIDAFGESQEFQDRFGSLSNTQLVTNLYDQLFGREPDLEGLEFFVDRLDSGESNLQEISIQILDGIQGDDVIIVDNRLEFSEYYVINSETGAIDDQSAEDLANLTASIDVSAESLSEAISVANGSSDRVYLTLSGDEENPATGSNASGNGFVTLNLNTGALSGSITVNGIEATAAHIHTGFAGVNGNVSIGLEVDDDNSTTWRVPDDTILDADLMESFDAGELYVNVHSEANPGGEIRAQILPENIDLIVTKLSGNNEVPTVESEASGRASLTVNTDNMTIDLHAMVSGLDDANAAHIHGGFAGLAGGVRVGLEQDVDDMNHWFVDSTVLSEDDYAALRDGELYVNVHSPANPGGEIRGQLLPDNIAVIQTTLSGDSEVPAVTSTASGQAALTVNTDDMTIVLHAMVSGLDDANAAHIHRGFAGLVSCIKLTVDMRAFDAHAPLLSKSPQHFLSIRTVFYLRYVFR